MSLVRVTDNGRVIKVTSPGPQGAPGGGVGNPSSLLTSIKTVDGTGSGLDADLLDGQHGAYFAPLASPGFTGNPTAPTQTVGNNSTLIATTAFVKGEIDVLKGGVPSAYDTLVEISNQLATDESAVAGLVTTVAGKLAKASNLSDLVSVASARTNLGLGSMAVVSATPFKYVHLLAGVTGTGTSVDPYTGFDATIAAASEQTTFKFIAGYFTTATGLLVTNSHVVLDSDGGTIIRSSQVAYPTKSVTSLTSTYAGSQYVDTLVTATVTAHGYTVGDQVVIAGAAQAEYNGCFTIYDVSDANTFHYHVIGTASATPATGTITARKARVMLTISKAYNASLADYTTWKARVRNLLLDGQGTIEVGVVGRYCWDSEITGVEWRDFVEWNGKTTNSGVFRIKGCTSVSRAPWPLSTTTVKNMFLLGELDPNPLAVTEGGSFQMSIADSCFYGCAGTIYEIPNGEAVQVRNGWAGGAPRIMRLGRFTSDFVFVNTDFENTGISQDLIIDGLGHKIEATNCLGTTIVVNGSNANPALRGQHLFINLYGLTGIVNNCDVFSEAINYGTDTTVITGTHPEKMIRRNKGGSAQLVSGLSQQFNQSVSGDAAVYTLVCPGHRFSHIIANLNGLYIVDEAGTLDPNDPAAVAAAAVVAVVGKTATFANALALPGVTVSGNGNRSLNLLSSDGNVTYVEMFSAGNSLGYMAVGNSAMYISCNGSLVYNPTTLEAEHAIKIPYGTRNVNVAGNLGVTGNVAASKRVTTGTVASGSTGGTYTPVITDANQFNFSLTSNLTIANPTGTPIDGQVIGFRITQAGSGSYTLTLGNKFRGCDDVTLPYTLSTTVGKVDYVSAVYNAAADKYDCLPIRKGYT